MVENNQRVAEVLRNVANILSLLDDNPFRIRAYERAAQNIEGLSEDIKILIEQDKLTSIPGIGKDLAGKISLILETGTFPEYEELKLKVPEGVLKILEIPSVGPKTAKLLYQRLGIDSIQALEENIYKGRLVGLPGIKSKTIENILKGIELVRKGKERLPLYKALEVASRFLEPLKRTKGVKYIEPAGSLRRRKDTIGDIDILVVSSSPQKIMEAFVKISTVKQVLAKGHTKSSVLTKDDIQVDLRVVEEKSFGAALMYFTGSKAFNIKVRQIALKKGCKINEYGVFKGSKYVCGKNEKEIFDFLGMQYIPACMREDNGEIELALKRRLPRLVSSKDILGDLHVHSKYSDGGHSVEEICEFAKSLGYKFIGITDHSRSLKVARGLSIDTLKKKIRHIKELNKKFKNFRVLCGAEVDILNDGSLDYPDNILKKLDIVIAAIHSGFKQSKDKLTLRIIKALRNPYVDIIAHPTGRLWGVRDSYDIDLDRIIDECLKYNKALEINCFPQRLDLNDANARLARGKGVLLSLGTDAHILDQLRYMNLGLDVACRAWCTPKDLVNCFRVEQIFALKSKRINKNSKK